MKVAFSLLIVVFAFGALAAIRYPYKFRSAKLKTAFILLGALAGFGVAGRSLYELSDGFNRPAVDCLEIGLLAPLGWFLGSCFLVVYTCALGKVDRDKTPPIRKRSI